MVDGMERTAFLGKLVSYPLTTLAGCQFLTVEALATKEYSAVGFYERCGFAPNEVKKPYKDILRMYMTLYSKDELLDD